MFFYIDIIDYFALDRAPIKKFLSDSQKEDKRQILAVKKRHQKDFDKEMKEFLTARKELRENKDHEMEEESAHEEQEELAPLPNVLSMIASSMKASGDQKEQEKSKVTRVSSFKEPDAPPNSVERVEDRLSPVTREERQLLDYDEDFLGSSVPSEDLDLF